MIRGKLHDFPDLRLTLHWGVLWDQIITPRMKSYTTISDRNGSAGLDDLWCPLGCRMIGQHSAVQGCQDVSIIM